ncbi:MAG: hypothetical protein KKA73_00380 [Chloroflexi bacterium]|nr:hypothetical protein [Chloroflexota bacterium]MBU1746118.1 hypothetical protein [Chloroflexota bacterium]MBU1878896.1 hypothetical protein [Chloroflexota bacterium]
MDGKRREYHSYLLRLWEVDDDQEGPIWRASLESPGTGERRGFASLDALFAFLAETTGADTGHPAPARKNGSVEDR